MRAAEEKPVASNEQQHKVKSVPLLVPNTLLAGITAEAIVPPRCWTVQMSLEDNEDRPFE